MTDVEIRRWELPLTWTTPPLTLNARLHWTAKDRRVGEIRDEAIQWARVMRIPELARFTVELHYRPARDGRRDAMNLYGTLKPLVDGLIQAEVADDDDPAHFVDRPPIIHPAEPGKGGRMWAVVIELGAETTTEGETSV